MMIEELTRQESYALLARVHHGRLACSQGNQPYVVPFSFTYHERSLYGFSTVGKKIEWMRANPLVCVEVEEIEDDLNWRTAIAFGLYEEFPDCPECEGSRAFTWELLQQRANWWEPGFVKTVVDGRERPLMPVFYRILINEISGRRLVPDHSDEAACRQPAEMGFWSGIFHSH